MNNPTHHFDMNSKSEKPSNPTCVNAKRTPIALITGAGKRIGRAIALHLAHAGYDLAIHYHQSVDDANSLLNELQILGRKAKAYSCDLSNGLAVRSLIPQVCADFGHIDCVINNAARFDQDDCTQIDIDGFEQQMRVNVLAPMLLGEGLYRVSDDKNPAVIIHLLDQKLINLNPDFASYTLSKAALQTAVTIQAQAMAPRVRVVGVAPGISLASGDQTSADFQKAHQATPMGKSSTPEDIAETIEFVLRQRAITGTTIVVDGGQHLVPTKRDVMFLMRSD